MRQAVIKVICLRMKCARCCLKSPAQVLNDYSRTKPNKGFLNRIPIQAKDWNVNEPGTLQADTVAHCGDGLLGSFVYSLTATDLHSGWTENRATWNKGMSGVIAQITTIERGLPFFIQSFKTDSGTEFMNHMLKG